MHNRRDGSYHVITPPNRPHDVVQRYHVNTRIWPRHGSPEEYELVADFYRRADGKKTHAFSEPELVDVMKGAFEALALIRKHRRRQRWLRFIRTWFQF